MTYEIIDRDCHSCGHAVNRHEPIGKVLTMVCLLKACGVRPHELKETMRAPCGTVLYADGVAPRRWFEAGR